MKLVAEEPLPVVVLVPEVLSEAALDCVDDEPPVTVWPKPLVVDPELGEVTDAEAAPLEALSEEVLHIVNAETHEVDDPDAEDEVDEALVLDEVAGGPATVNEGVWSKMSLAFLRDLI